MKEMSGWCGCRGHFWAIPVVPLYVGIFDEAFEHAGEGAPREGNGELALLIESLLLNFYDEFSERQDEIVFCRKRIENWGVRRVKHWW